MEKVAIEGALLYARVAVCQVDRTRQGGLCVALAAVSGYGRTHHSRQSPLPGRVASDLLIWFLRDIDLLSVLARAATLAFEALLLGGVAFLLAVARPARASVAVDDFCRRGIRIAAVALVVGEFVLLFLSGALLMSGSDLTLKDVTTTGFFRADLFAILLAIGLWICARSKSNKATFAMLPLSVLLLAATVSTSHAAARIEHRVLLAILTAAHHLGTAAWIGAMVYLLISLGRVEDQDEARRLTQRYSRMALLGAATLVLAGTGMAWFYVGPWSGLYTTAYGIMLVAKIFLLLAMIALGAGNWFLVRRLASDPTSSRQRGCVVSSRRMVWPGISRSVDFGRFADRTGTRGRCYRSGQADVPRDLRAPAPRTAAHEQSAPGGAGPS